MHNRLLPLLCVLSCGPAPQKTYSSDIGVTPVPTSQGALAGTWVGQKEFATIIKLPIVGDRNAGANGGRLINITHDGGDVYTVSMTWCWDDVFEVEGTTNSFTDESLHALRPLVFKLTVDHANGIVDSARIVDLWGLHNMPNPDTDPLPKKSNYTSQPQSDWVLDEDMDSHPGVTVHMSGSLEGTGSIVNRSIYKLHGVVKSVDEMLGIMPGETNQQNLLEANVNIPGADNAETDQRPDPDPKNSWFQFHRAATGATCQDALTARSNGTLGTKRPF